MQDSTLFSIPYIGISVYYYIRMPCFVSNFYFDYCNYIVLDDRDSRQGERKKSRLYTVSFRK